jgi:hypothetical protein
MDVTQRAARARAILDDPLFTEAFDVLICTQIDVFKSEACDDAQLIEAQRMVRALNAVRDQLTSVITDGQLFEHRIRKGQHRG